MAALSKEDLDFDDDVAASYVGKYILVGLTFLDSAGEVKYRQQVHGVVQSASIKGITIALRGVYDGETWNMPPLLSSIRPAKPGTYVLEMSGEKIEDPDLLAGWTVQEPPNLDQENASPAAD